MPGHSPQNFRTVGLGQSDQISAAPYRPVACGFLSVRCADPHRKSLTAHLVFPHGFYPIGGGQIISIQNVRIFRIRYWLGNNELPSLGFYGDVQSNHFADLPGPGPRSTNHMTTKNLFARFQNHRMNSLLHSPYFDD